jgi:thioredoxin
MDRLIDENTVAELKAKLSAEMKNPVEVKVFINAILDPAQPQQAELNEFAVELVKELHGIDPRIIPQQDNFNSPIAKELGLETSPSIVIGYDEGYRIIYSGSPLGHEASAFIETIVLASRGEAGFGAESSAVLSKMDKPVKIHVFVTPDCPYCPQSVMIANRMAIHTRGRVTAICVESVENQALARKFNVSSVPQQVINEDMASVTIGAQTEKNFVLQALKYSAPAEYEKMTAAETARKAGLEKLPDSPEGVIYLSDNNFDQALAKYENLTVDFWAEWCGPCKILGPIIEQLAAEFKGKAVFGKLNVDENTKIAGRYGIMSIPAVYYFKKGEKAGETIGALPKQSMQDAVKNNFKL